MRIEHQHSELWIKPYTPHGTPAFHCPSRFCGDCARDLKLGGAAPDPNSVYTPMGDYTGFIDDLSGQRDLDKLRKQPVAPPPQLTFGNNRDKAPLPGGAPGGPPLSFGPPPPAGGKTQPPAWAQPSLPLSMGTPVSDRGPKPPQYPLGVPVSGGGWKPAAPVQPKLKPNPADSARDRQQPPGSGGGWQNDHRDRQAGLTLPASGGSGGGGGSVSNPDKMPKQRCLAGRSGAAGGVAFGLRRVWPVARIQRCPAPSGSGFRQAVGRHGAVQMGL